MQISTDKSLNDNLNAHVSAIRKNCISKKMVFLVKKLSAVRFPNMANSWILEILSVVRNIRLVRKTKKRQDKKICIFCVYSLRES